MSNKTVSPSGVSLRTAAYEGFSGLDDSRPADALESNKAQPLLNLVNGFCDWRGQMVKDAGAKKIAGENSRIKHVGFYSTAGKAWAEYHNSAVTLRSDLDHVLEDIYPAKAVVTSAYFGGRLHFFSAGEKTYSYDGAQFRAHPSPQDPRPAFGVAVTRRLAIAGFPNKPTEVHFSRVDNADIQPLDEKEGSNDALRAAILDVRDFLNRSGRITGLGSFENNRLAIFTDDQTIVYKIDPDIEEWKIEENSNIQVGCISHNTIQRAGTDLLFCSRDGVHAMRRSQENGITVYSFPLSNKIDLTYRKLVRSVENPAEISAVFDQDEGQYHIFFPQPDGQHCKRLTLTLNPVEPAKYAWSSGDFLQARCGAFLAGSLVLGTPGGLWEVGEIEDEMEISPSMVAETPILWHGDINNNKEALEFILHAAGKGTVMVEAFNEEGVKFNAFTFHLETDDTFPDVPIKRQYKRKFEHRYRGVQFRLTASGAGLIRITGFAVNVRK